MNLQSIELPLNTQLLDYEWEPIQWPAVRTIFTMCPWRASAAQLRRFDYMDDIFVWGLDHLPWCDYRLVMTWPGSWFWEVYQVLHWFSLLQVVEAPAVSKLRFFLLRDMSSLVHDINFTWSTVKLFCYIIWCCKSWYNKMCQNVIFWAKQKKKLFDHWVFLY